MLLYTDGLTAARHDDGRLLGVDAVGATLRELEGHSPAQVVSTLSSQARRSQPASSATTSACSPHA